MTTLVTVRAGLTLDSPAAASWVRMETAKGSPLDVNRSYADWDTQMGLYLAYQRDPIRNPLALHPKDSWHCQGLAVDTDDDAWIRRNPQFGWRFVVASEKWHAQYYEKYDLTVGQTAGTGEVDFMSELDDASKKWVRQCFREELSSYFEAYLKPVNDKLDAIQDGDINYPGADFSASEAIVNAIREERNLPKT